MDAHVSMSSRIGIMSVAEQHDEVARAREADRRKGNRSMRATRSFDTPMLGLAVGGGDPE